MTILIGLLAILVLVALTQLVRVFEISGKLRGNNQDKVEYGENKFRGFSWLIFGAAYFGFFAYLVYAYGPHMLPESASEHGVTVDTLLNFNFLIITIAFVITHVLLFYFASKYYWSPNRKAEFITHNNKLELIWTTFPAIILAIIIIYGLSTWNEMTKPAGEDAVVIELYSKQFDWTARYAGKDKKLGASDINFINTTNPLGLITPETIQERIAEVEGEITKLQEEIANSPKGGIKEKNLTDKFEFKKRQLGKLYAFDRKNTVDQYASADDDKIVKVEFYIPVNKQVDFRFRSQDVIHSAYMPHFRAQMNTVPGTPTSFQFTPTITSKEMKLKTGNPDFEYILLCNKICGAAHYNMQMNIIVVSETEYEQWLSEQKTFTSVETAENRKTSFTNNSLAEKN